MRQRLIHAAVNVFFPPHCLLCDARVLAHGALCTPCWKAAAFIAEPLCDACGTPFEYRLDSLCAECMGSPPPFAQARAVMAYNDTSRLLVMKLKYQDQAALAATFGPWLANAGAPLLAASDLIVPVPLHYRRYLKRRYNQAALLAAALSRHSGIVALPDALTRIRPTVPQSGLSRTRRQQNVAAAFRANTRVRDRLAGKRILLIDDVYTTGATLSACAHTLLAAGAREVRALTLTRRT